VVHDFFQTLQALTWQLNNPNLKQRQAKKARAFAFKRSGAYPFQIE